METQLERLMSCLLRMNRDKQKKTDTWFPILIGCNVDLPWGFVNLLRQDSRCEKDVSEIRCDVRKQGLTPGWPLSDGIY